MAQDLSAVKSNFASQTSALAAALIKLCNQATELTAEYFAQGLNSGGANQYAQADLVGGNAFLTPAAIAGVITQLQTLNTTFGPSQLNVLRQAIVTPQI